MDDSKGIRSTVTLAAILILLLAPTGGIAHTGSPNFKNFQFSVLALSTVSSLTRQAIESSMRQRQKGYYSVWEHISTRSYISMLSSQCSPKII